MKKYLVLSLICLAFAGCYSNDKSRMEYIERKFNTREIVPLHQETAYIVRLSDGSVLLIERNNESKPENLSYRQIFSPMR